MQLTPGRLKNLIAANLQADSALICHDTLQGDNAICRGFFDRYETTPIQLAIRLDKVTYVDPPTKGEVFDARQTD
jgi:hypothetical protein